MEDQCQDLAEESILIVDGFIPNSVKQEHIQ